jgi:hypothetical protein
VCQCSSNVRTAKWKNTIKEGKVGILSSEKRRRGYKDHEKLKRLEKKLGSAGKKGETAVSFLRYTTGLQQ